MRLVLELRLAVVGQAREGQESFGEEVTQVEGLRATTYVTPAPMAAVLLTPPVTVLSKLSA